MLLSVGVCSALLIVRYMAPSIIHCTASKPGTECRCNNLPVGFSVVLITAAPKHFTNIPNNVPATFLRAFVPHPLPSGTMPLPGPHFPWIWTLVPKPALLPGSMPLHNITQYKLPHVSSCHSFFHLCFSSSYLFALTLAESLHPANGDTGVLLFTITFWFPCVEQRIEKATTNICKNVHPFSIISMKHFIIPIISQRCYIAEGTYTTPNFSISCHKKCLTQQSSGRWEKILLLLR